MMKKFNRKGFTLVELLVTIVLLGIVATIIIFNMTNVSNQTRESDYEKFVAGVKSAASVYADTNPDVFNDLYVNKAFLYITIKDLVTNGLYDGNTINPYTEEKVSFDEKIKANLDSSSGQLTFTYPLNDTEKETFLVALSDYVVWGETLKDCMVGSGTYQLSLSTEEGNLIDINPNTEEGKKNIEKYHVTCSLPEDFNPKQEGVYNITYNWLTESGTRKTARRELRVMAKVEPTFKTNYAYDFKNDTWFTPNWNKTKGEWEVLKISPLIEQSDESTTFTVTKKKLLPSEGQSEPAFAGKLTDYANKWVDVDDGSKEYTISTTIKGHYDPTYSYETSGKVRINSKLIIPEPFITAGGSDWATERKFTIEEPHSPVGISKYEYRLLSSGDTVSNAEAVNDKFTFPKDGQYTDQVIGLGAVGCTSTPIKYERIAFRAINNDGYVGDWTIYDNAYITNQLSLILPADCATCGTKCQSTGTNTCYYTTKDKWIQFGPSASNKFVILERYSNGNILAAYQNTYSNVSPMSMQSGSVTIQTCDGSYTIYYSYTSASLSVIKNYAQGFLKLLPSNYYDFINFRNWPYGGNAYVGNIDLAMFNRYSGALSSSTMYWTTSTRSELSTSSYYATAYNTYVYYIINSSYSTGYAGMTAPLKPILEFKPVQACSGNGSFEKPYRVAS